MYDHRHNLRERRQSGRQTGYRKLPAQRMHQHCQDVGINFGSTDITVATTLYFVGETFREQRTQRTVDQARSQNFFRRTAFTFEETTGYGRQRKYAPCNQPSAGRNPDPA